MSPSTLSSSEQVASPVSLKRKKLAVVVQGYGYGTFSDQHPELKEVAQQGKEAVSNWFDEHYLYHIRAGETVPRWLEKYFDIPNPDYIWSLGATPPNG